MTDATSVDQRAARLQFERFLEAIDPDAVRPRLAAVLAAGPDEPLEVRDAKYELGRDATVLYRLGDRLVRGTVSPREDDTLGAPVAPGLRVATYPDDAGLPTLDAVTQGPALAEALDVALGESVQCVGATTHLLRYRPGRRATFAVRADLIDADGPRTADLVAKVYHDGAKASAVAAEGRAMVSGDVDPDLVLAPIVAHLPDLRVVVQGRLPGVELATPLHRPDDEGPHLTTVRRAAAALAALHRHEVPEGRRRPITKELDRFVSRASGIGVVAPEAGAALLDLAHRVRAVHPGVPTTEASLVHGDCKPSQFLVSDERVAILDLDHCGLGDPAYDAANFTSSLRQYAVRADPTARGVTDDLAWAERLAAEFTDQFADSRGNDPTLRRRMDFYAAVALTRKALRAFSKAPRSPLSLAYVAEAHRGLDHTIGDIS